MSQIAGNGWFSMISCAYAPSAPLWPHKIEWTSAVPLHKEELKSQLWRCFLGYCTSWNAFGGKVSTKCICCLANILNQRELKMQPLRIYLAQKFIHCLPETRFFALKRAIYRWCGIKIGKNVRICSSAILGGCGDIMIGDNTWIGAKTMIQSGCRVEIGSNVDIAPLVFIGTGTHEITPEEPHVAGKGIQKPTCIGNGAWLGAGQLFYLAWKWARSQS